MMYTAENKFTGKKSISEALKKAFSSELYNTKISKHMAKILAKMKISFGIKK